MSNNLHDDVVAQVAQKYRQDGYEVFVEPSGGDIPGFLGNFRPDIIAKGPKDSAIVEIKLGTELSAAERYSEIAEQVNNQPGWRFSLVYVNPTTPDEIWYDPPLSMAKLMELANEGKTLLNSGANEAAFLLLWSVVEGMLRQLSLKNHLAAENLPARALIRELYSSGELSLEHFKNLDALLSARNRLAHGFDAATVETDARRLAGTVDDLLVEVSA